MANPSDNDTLDPPVTFPFPALEIQPTSRLSFPWAEYNPSVQGTFDASFGPDGVGLGMVMIIYWQDLVQALTELLGYSWREPPTQPTGLTTGGPIPPTPAVLHRKLPWQHPLFDQLWVKRVSRVQGIRLQGKGNQFVLQGGGGNVLKGGVGGGSLPPAGAGSTWRRSSAGTGAGGSGVEPTTLYNLALLTIQFWRPPYAVRTDQDVMVNGQPQEWLRYVDRHWQVDTQMLSREGSVFLFGAGQGDVSGKQFPGSVGQPLSKLRISRKWYQLPEEAVFSLLADGTPGGLPNNLLYMQTKTTNRGQQQLCRGERRVLQRLKDFARVW
jgi:hypothetical protein